MDSVAQSRTLRREGLGLGLPPLVVEQPLLLRQRAVATVRAQYTSTSDRCASSRAVQQTRRYCAARATALAVPFTAPVRPGLRIACA